MRNEGSREDGNYSDYAWDRDDGCPFVFKFCWHLVLNLFTPAQLLGSYPLIKGCADFITLVFTHQYNSAADIKTLGNMIWCLVLDFLRLKVNNVSSTILLVEQCFFLPLLMVQTHASNKKKC
jgi:hypothetical protein